MLGVGIGNEQADTEDGLKRDFSFFFGTGGKLPVFNGPLGT